MKLAPYAAQIFAGRRRELWRWCAIASVLTLLLVTRAAQAAPTSDRYALLIGANHGRADEVSLRYAVRDAQRVGETLVRLGGFLPENVVVLEEPSADRVRDALARLNARIRVERYGRPGGVLLIYYSGHADAQSLHLGATTLPWDELRNLGIGSAATTRLLIVDACRSGQATRVKGSQLDEPFALPVASEPTPEGFAILSSTTAGESAQESDALQSSFFTHHFLAALRGVADQNADSRITLGEAYQYTARSTVASTASTLAGIQHPTYHYELKGRGDLVLTQLNDNRQLAALRLSQPGQYLLWRDGSSAGPLALEANVGSERRTVHLEPGKYLIQRRLPARFLEGTARLVADSVTDIRNISMKAIEYDRLVRKGGRINGRSRAYASALWLGVSQAPVSDLPAQRGVAVSATTDSATLTLEAMVGLSQRSSDEAQLRTTLSSITAAVGARKVFDIGPTTLSAGLRAGLTLLDQRYQTAREAPSRQFLMPWIAPVLHADYLLTRGYFIGFDANIGLGYLRLRDQADGAENQISAMAQLSFGVGKRW